tara:strand:- start:35 stop:625 length:591 start_codon:yes stop_codon:yes gene_type:complete
MTFSKWELQKGEDYIVKKKPDSISEDDLAFIEKYALWLEETSDWQSDSQSPDMFNAYRNPIMSYVQYFLHKEIEKATGLNLLPTYNYFRIYRNGAILEKHTDRPACEVSATMLIAKNYSPTWAFHVGEGDTSRAVVQDVGDYTIYRGCELNHWRETWETDADNYHIQLFVHFIDADGPHISHAGDAQNSTQNLIGM